MKNGKSVIVEITDRGPFVKSREIDLLKELLWTLPKKVWWESNNSSTK
jgi:hypothetical protein